jgi:hypothetical protein
MIIEQQRLARRILVAAPIGEPLPGPLHLQCGLLSPFQSLGI